MHLYWITYGIFWRKRKILRLFVKTQLKVSARALLQNYGKDKPGIEAEWQKFCFDGMPGVLFRFLTCWLWRGPRLVSKYWYTPVLILEWRLVTLELFWLVFQAVDPEPPARRANHGHGIVDVRCVDAFAHVNVHDGVGRTRVPELDSLIPGPRHQSLWAIKDDISIKEMSWLDSLDNF